MCRMYIDYRATSEGQNEIHANQLKRKPSKAFTQHSFGAQKLSQLLLIKTWSAGPPGPDFYETLSSHADARYMSFFGHTGGVWIAYSQDHYCNCLPLKCLSLWSIVPSFPIKENDRIKWLFESWLIESFGSVIFFGRRLIEKKWKSLYCLQHSTTQ